MFDRCWIRNLWQTWSRSFRSVKPSWMLFARHQTEPLPFNGVRCKPRGIAEVSCTTWTKRRFTPTYPYCTRHFTYIRDLKTPLLAFPKFLFPHKDILHTFFYWLHHLYTQSCDWDRLLAGRYILRSFLRELNVHSTCSNLFDWQFPSNGRELAWRNAIARWPAMPGNSYMLYSFF